jgi:hypothetical protein
MNNDTALLIAPALVIIAANFLALYAVIRLAVTHSLKAPAHRPEPPSQRPRTPGARTVVHSHYLGDCDEACPVEHR